MSRATRYFIERRTGPKTYHPIGTQPAEGFAKVEHGVDWLLAKGWVRRRLYEDGDPYLEGFGGERGFYLREREVELMQTPGLVVIGGRPVQVRTIGEFVELYGDVPAPGRPLYVEPEKPALWRLWRSLADRLGAR